MKRPLIAVAAVALGAFALRSRRKRSLHPLGRSFTGELEVWGIGEDAELLSTPRKYRATVRLSKGAGTPGGRADVRGLAVRVDGERPFDLLLSTCGEGRFTRHLPSPRRTFDTYYGSITPFRTGTGHKVYMAARADRDAPLGRDLDSVTGGRITLYAGDRAFGRVSLGEPLSERTDAELAFDPIRNTAPDLHPTGTIHGTRAFAYRLSQRWRGARPADPAPEAVERTVLHR
ncbi:hypothetical protein [Actinoplanes sp. URMC 104]|uniref:hypothetical protein n=1 Tax=Actinoplanes sp. URMC 104 TaxID=3423409 RepID=UPI003F1C8C79